MKIHKTRIVMDGDEWLYCVLCPIKLEGGEVVAVELQTIYTSVTLKALCTQYVRLDCRRPCRR